MEAGGSSENDREELQSPQPTSDSTHLNSNNNNGCERETGSPCDLSIDNNLANAGSSSEKDREASSCGSPPDNANCTLDGPAGGSSENDKELSDGGNMMAASMMMMGDGGMDGQNPEPKTPSQEPKSPSGVPTFHGSRSASHIGRKPAFGQTCSMKTLLQDGILQTGEKVLTLEYEGSKFFGDLRRDGTIMMRGPDERPHIYATPVAWANHCCKMLNPESKPLNAWSSIRFKGKRLDSYKLKWYRAQKAQKKPTTNTGAYNNTNLRGNASGMVGGVGGSNFIANLERDLLNAQSASLLTKGTYLERLHEQALQREQQQQQQQQQGSSKLMIHNPIANYFPQYENPIKNKKLIRSLLISNNMDIECKRLVAKSLDNDDENNNATVINYEQLGTRGAHNTHNPNTMVKCIPFSAVDRIQPFNVTVSTNALLLVEFHSHLVNGEVAGYLAGSWDPGQHTLTVTQAFPCRAVLNDESVAATVEEDIRQDIEKRNLCVVGWYHSHQGKYSNHPTIKDIQNQMEHQITMKESASGYTPCIGLICSPHDIRSEDDLSPSFQIYWVMPPPEHLVYHYGRPMQMYYSVVRDLFLTQDLLLEMRLLANFHNSEMVDFNSTYEYNNRITNLEKLSESIKPKLPRDLQESEYPDEPAIWKAAVDHFWKFLRNLVVNEPEEQ